MTELPPPTDEVRRLIDIIGAEATLRLVERWGGTRIYVPAQVRPGSELARVIGLDGARYFAQRYGGEQFTVPVARHWRAIAYRMRGMSYAQIARATGSSESAIYRILRNAAMVERQLSLFD